MNHGEPAGCEDAVELAQRRADLGARAEVVERRGRDDDVEAPGLERQRPDVRDPRVELRIPPPRGRDGLGRGVDRHHVVGSDREEGGQPLGHGLVDDRRAAEDRP